MTVVVGLQTNDGVLFGADSATLAGWDVRHHGPETAKLWTQGRFVFGHSGDVRWAQLLRYVWEPPEPPETVTLGWLIRTVATSMRDIAKQYDCLVKPKETEPAVLQSSFLFAIDGRIYRLFANFTVMPVEHGYDALGCAEDLALGALYATEGRTDPETRVRLALEAAAAHNAAIRGPFTYLVAPAATPTLATNGVSH